MVLPCHIQSIDVGCLPIDSLEVLPENAGQHPQTLSGTRNRHQRMPRKPQGLHIPVDDVGSQAPSASDGQMFSLES